MSICDGFDFTNCALLVSGDPDVEEPVAGCPAATLLLAGCDGTQQSWVASLVVSGYDSFNEETFLVYNVTQPGAGVVEHTTISWTGNCCVRYASFCIQRIVPFLFLLSNDIY
jgi:hypothetical protein